MHLLTPLLLLTSPQIANLEAQIKDIEEASKGRLGVAILSEKGEFYARKSERFSIQSVMKLVVSMTALDLVDQGQWKPGKKFIFSRNEASVSVQPLLEKLGKKKSITVSLEDCIELTVTQSCSASGDLMFRNMGGKRAIDAFLKKRGITGLSVDRQERDLQTFIKGLAWKPSYVDPAKFEADIKKVPESSKDAAYKRYQADTRDTSTPEAFGMLLKKLVKGQLLSKRSTQYLLGVMERTVTGEDRLKAGMSGGWKLGHKTGTSSSNKGVSCATNDIGIVRRPNGDWMVIVALLGDSTANDDERALAISRVAKAALGSDLAPAPK